MTRRICYVCHPYTIYNSHPFPFWFWKGCSTPKSTFEEMCLVYGYIVSTPVRIGRRIDWRVEWPRSEQLCYRLLSLDPMYANLKSVLPYNSQLWFSVYEDIIMLHMQRLRLWTCISNYGSMSNIILQIRELNNHENKQRSQGSHVLTFLVMLTMLMRETLILKLLLMLTKSSYRLPSLSMIVKELLLQLQSKSHFYILCLSKDLNCFDTDLWLKMYHTFSLLINLWRISPNPKAVFCDFSCCVK